MAAQSGMTVCAVIHQPRTSVFALFDDLILLGRTSAKFGGRTVYCGPTGRAVEYFEGLGYAFPPKENPADVFIDIVSGTHSDFRPVSSPLEAAVAPLAPLQGGTGTPPGPSDRKVLGGGGRRGAAGLRSPRLNLADAWAVNAERHAAAMALRIGGNPAEMTGAGAGGFDFGGGAGAAGAGASGAGTGAGEGGGMPPYGTLSGSPEEALSWTSCNWRSSSWLRDRTRCSSASSCAVLRGRLWQHHIAARARDAPPRQIASR